MVDAPLQRILKAGFRALDAEHLSNQTWLVATTVGTLTACKLIFRLHNEGTGTFSGEPEEWEKIERMSDDLAGANAHVLDRIARGSTIPALRREAPGRFLRLVRTRTTFQWCLTTASADGPLPVDPKVLEEVPPHIDKVWLAIWNSLAQRRARLRSKQVLAYNEMFELIGAGVAAKLFLALWGNGTVAARLERHAEERSEDVYQMLHETGKLRWV